jgi:hypothetical protein
VAYYPLIASLINPFPKDQSGDFSNWSELAIQLLTATPNADQVLEELLAALDEINVSFHPRETLEVKRKLIEQLDNTKIVSSAKYIQKVDEINCAIDGIEDERQFVRGFE